MQPTTIVLNRRIYSIDVLRGIVMILMALDHVRDFFHNQASLDSPTNLATTSVLLFFTRWVTHFCAPTFVLLSGISAFLMGQKKTKKNLSIFLMKRGIWLVLVEVLIVSFGWTYNPFYNVLILQVIWAIGISMFILGILVWLPSNAILAGGLIVICFHNLLDYAEISRHGQVNLLWEFAHQASFAHVQWAPHHIAVIAYAFLPWTGIMMTGYGMGVLFTSRFSAEKRRSWLLITGFASILLFVILRTINIYGDSSPWSHQRSHVFSFLSFINFSKYPPSLDYIAVTVGAALIALAMLDRISKNSFSFFRVYGSVPFFYYIIHLYLIHAVTVIVFFLEKYPASDIAAQHKPFLFRPDHFGFSLAGVYLIWISIVLLLYPLCKWYQGYKATHKQWWLSYM